MRAREGQAARRIPRATGASGKEGGPSVTGFIGTWIHQIDAKGRVSVPASFRTVVQAKGRNDVALYPSPIEQPCIEGCGTDRIDLLIDSTKDEILPNLDDDSEYHLLFGEVRKITFDADGRIVLPDEFIQHAQLTDQAAFVGVGRRFQIWTPSALKVAREDLRRRVALKRRLPPVPGGGDNP